MKDETTIVGNLSWRHYCFYTLVLFIGIVFLGRIIYLGAADKDFLQRKGKISEKLEVIPAVRGSIIDRNGEVLAVSTPGYSISINPNQENFSDGELKIISTVLKLDVDRLRSSINHNQNKKFLFIKRKVSREIGDFLRTFDIEGLNYDEEYHRYYPAAETSAHVIGRTNIDGIGSEGIELTRDSLLQGRRGEKLVLRDRKGGLIRNLNYRAPPIFGKDVRLTIDLNLQFIAYKELKSAIESHRARSGSLVMLDARSGEILAMVNQPSYNPNESVPNMEVLRNRAVTDAYEPGSTIKPFAMLAALESGNFRPDSVVDTSPGTYLISGHQIKDPTNYGALSLSKIIQFSSNVGISKIALDLPHRAIFEVLGRSGFGRSVDIGLPGEARGSLKPNDLEISVQRAALAYGYGLTVTPLQLANAYLKIASHGENRRTSLFKGEFKPAFDRIYREFDTKEVIKMMETVTEIDGTGKAAAVEGYRIAGKTGTAQRFVNGRFDPDSHNVWFVGIVPAYKPRLVTVVVVNDPKAGASGGGTVAAPIFAQVARHSLRVLGIEPEKTIPLASSRMKNRVLERG